MKKPFRNKFPSVLLCFTLILAITVSGLTFPGFLLPLFGKVKTDSKDKPESSQQSGTQNGKENNEQTTVATPVEWVGHSKAFTITPFEGVTVSAQENALDKDRTFEISALNDDELEEVVDAYAAAMNDSYYPLGGMHISAGLAPDELLPEGYTVQIDLASMGVPEDLWNSVTAFRRDDNGMYYEYASYLQDGKLTFESQQNGIIGWITAAGVIWYCGDELLPTIGTGISWVMFADHIYVTESESPNSKKIFKLKWTLESGELVQTKYVLELHKKLEKEYTWIDAKKDLCREKGLDPETNWDTYDCKKGEVSAYRANRIDKIIEEGITPAAKEYREAYEKAEKMVRQHLTPELVLEIGKRLRYAREYLKTLGIKMPKACMTVELVPKITGSDAAGVSVSPLLFMSNYMVLQTQELAKKPSEYDDLTVTAVHEYFHACTNCYKSQNHANLKINEATAQIIEVDCEEWLIEHGYIGAKTKHENEKKMEMYGLPLDLYKVKYADGSAKEYTGSDKSDTGYPLCHFIRYLMKKIPKATDKGSAWHNILATYCKYWLAPDVTEFLKDCFGLNDESLSNYYYLFAQSEQSKFYEKAKYSFTDYNSATRWVYPITSCDKGDPAYALLDDHNYTIRVRQMIPYSSGNYYGDVSMLVVCDPDFTENLPDTKILPIGNTAYRKTRYGFFYLPMKQAESDFFDCLMMEIDGGIGKSGKKSGYTIYCIEAPNTPKLRADNSNVKITIPKMSMTMDKGYMDGFRVTIKCSDGQETVKYYKRSSAGKTVSLSVDDLHKPLKKGAKEKKLTYTVSVCEYISESDKPFVYGPESEKASVDVGKNSGNDTSSEQTSDIPESKSTDDTEKSDENSDGTEADPGISHTGGYWKLTKTYTATDITDPDYLFSIKPFTENGLSATYSGNETDAGCNIKRTGYPDNMGTDKRFFYDLSLSLDANAYTEAPAQQYKPGEAATLKMSVYAESYDNLKASEELKNNVGYNEFSDTRTMAAINLIPHYYSEVTPNEKDRGYNKWGDDKPLHFRTSDLYGSPFYDNDVWLDSYYGIYEENGDAVKRKRDKVYKDGCIYYSSGEKSVEIQIPDHAPELVTDIPEDNTFTILTARYIYMEGASLSENKHKNDTLWGDVDADFGLTYYTFYVYKWQPV